VQFEPERTPWIEPAQLYSNISFVGASPMFPDVACDIGLTTCIVTTGEGEINAASTSEFQLSPPSPTRAHPLLSSLQSWPSLSVQSSTSPSPTSSLLVVGQPHLSLYRLTTDLSFFAVAGISSEVGTLGSAAWARFVVQGGLAYQIDGREIPSNWTDAYWALGTKQPGEMPDRKLVISPLFTATDVLMHCVQLWSCTELKVSLSSKPSERAIELTLSNSLRAQHESPRSSLQSHERRSAQRFDRSYRVPQTVRLSSSERTANSHSR